MLLRVAGGSSRKKSRWKALQPVQVGCKADLNSFRGQEFPPAGASSPGAGDVSSSEGLLGWSTSSLQPRTPQLPPNRRGGAGGGSLLPWWVIAKRDSHCGSLYVHHTTPGTSRDSASVSIGVLHTLERLMPGMGYFRPVDKTTIGGNRALLMKEIYGFKDSVEEMQGVTQQRALDLVTRNKFDDLMEDIFRGLCAEFDLLPRSPMVISLVILL
jgi:hypothetical protein